MFALSFLVAKVKMEAGSEGKINGNKNNSQNLLSADPVPGIKSFICKNMLDVHLK